MKQLDFGDYCEIEQRRFGCHNEMYRYKVVGRLRSNTFVVVPVQRPEIEIIHDEMHDVLLCICEGVDESRAFKFKEANCFPCEKID